MAHSEFDFETAYVTASSVVMADQGLAASYETPDALGVRQYIFNFSFAFN